MEWVTQNPLLLDQGGGGQQSGKPLGLDKK